MTGKHELRRLLEELSEKQKEVSRCHTCYEGLERELEGRKMKMANPEEYAAIEREIALLNREYEAKDTVLQEEVNALLLKGYDLSQAIGHEVAHDFKKLWDYMTQPTRHGVEFTRVLRDIEYLKQELG